MRLRGLNRAEPLELLDILERGLDELSNRAVTLAGEAGYECGDALGYLATDIARHVTVIEILREKLRWGATPNAVAAHRGGQDTEAADAESET